MPLIKYTWQRLDGETSGHEMRELITGSLAAGSIFKLVLVAEGSRSTEKKKIGDHNVSSMLPVRAALR